jgi:alkylated DNA repair protein (DNA oxidative demethylase)
MIDALIPRSRTVVADGAVHLPDWLDLEGQRRLVAACRDWARPGLPGLPGLRTVRLPGGGVMSVRMLCLGWHWYPYGYSKVVRDSAGDVPVPPMPGWLAELGSRAVAAAYRDVVAGAAYRPDVALVNFYDEAARMSLHQDRDERAREPVVSLSLGDACVFRFGNTENRNRPWTDVELRSGDLFVFGGPSRLAYHGVPKTLPGTADPAIGMITGRLNVTLRVSGL